MKSILRKIIFFAFIATVIWGQGNYYDGISTSSATFISDLQTLIRSNYVKQSYDQYDENMIPGFYAQDNGNGTNSIFCVYSSYEYIYSGTFTWTVFSREHTWCYSWMPSHGSTSTNEYSDYHHLFPTHQNGANGVRSNHPLGIVANISSTFGDAKYGTNADGEVVYEPRDEQKGDAARALFYMALKYDGVGGNDWSFNYLNNITLPSLSEAPQDLQTLLAWNEADPPDSIEKARNEYIYNLQHNRNPFIDHPEYVNYIDFNTMTKISLSADPEPSNHVTDFAGTSSYNSIDLTWTPNNGVNLPSGYLIKASTVSFGAISAPVDGTAENDDTDLSDNTGVVNVSSSSSSYSWSGLSSNTTYYFKIFPYSNSSNDIDYKIDGIVPTFEITTSSGTVFFTEYVEGSSYNKALEIGNKSTNSVDLSAGSYSIEIYYNGNSTGTTISLTGIISPHDVFVIAYPSADAAILTVADQTSGSLSFNGDDAVVLKKGTEILDVIGQIGFDPGTEWGSGLVSTADNTLRRKTSVYMGDSNGNDAFDPSIEWDGFATDSFDDLGTAVLPVELISFSANISGNTVNLKWSTATEINNYGFEIERTKVASSSLTSSRSTSATVWQKIAFIEGAGNSNSQKEYSFTDISLASGKYKYRLKQIDIDGKFKYLNEVEAEIVAPAKYTLEQNYPNPFNPSTVIQYSIPAVDALSKVEVHVTLKVYDILGNEIATLVNGYKSAGDYEVEFNASKLVSGIYIYRLLAGDFIQSKKMLLIK